MLKHTSKIRTQRSKIFVAIFLSGVFTYQTQQPEQDATSAVATPTTLNVPVLSTVFEIPRWPIHCYGPTLVTFMRARACVCVCVCVEYTIKIGSRTCQKQRKVAHWRFKLLLQVK